MYNLTVSFGAVRMRVSSADRSLPLDTTGAHRRFVVGDGPADAHLTAAWDDLSGREFGRLVYDSGVLWKMYASEGSFRCVFTSSFFGEAPYKVATFTPDFTSGEILLHRPYFRPDAPQYPLESPLDEILLNHLLADGRGAEVHSIGLVDRRGRGLLFPGQSGAGKSTTARLWMPHARTILSDDRIVLRPQGDAIRMYGTPWHGDAEVCDASSAPLHGVFFLQQGKTNSLVRLSRRDAAARFLTCAFIPFYRAESVAYTLEFYESVAVRVPCFELTFAPDGSVVAFVEERMESFPVLDGIEDNHE